jgi:hypothetical protein
MKIMAILKIRSDALWLNGWGHDDEGHMVYLPLWDQPKALPAALKNYYVADLLRGAATAVLNPQFVHAPQIDERGLCRTGIQGNGCGHQSLRHTVGTSACRTAFPAGAVISGITSDAARNAIIGTLLISLGKTVGDKNIAKLGGQMSA